MKKNKFLLLLIVVLQLAFIGSPEPKVDHKIWNELLTKHVGRNGVVNYLGFKGEKQKLISYINILQSNHPSSTWPKNEAKAYWINAYNAFTVKLILENYPIESIMKINNGKAWDIKFIKIGKNTYSLNNIEHDILRPKYKDARIHFAVNCASVSCPKLSNKAFNSSSLEKHLNDMTMAFLNDASKNKITAKEVKISKLFEWYESDFKMNGSVIDFINKYSKVQAEPDAKISYQEYNWNLNN